MIRASIQVSSATAIAISISLICLCYRYNHEPTWFPIPNDCWENDRTSCGEGKDLGMTSEVNSEDS